MKDVPRFIWSYWNNKELPELINLCLISWKTNLPDYTIKLLNSENIFEYITVSGDNKIKLSKLNLAKQSDYFRLCLLNKYGGFWVDASTFINKDLNFVHDSFKNDSELDVFFSIKNINYNKYEFYIWETFFIASKKKTNFIKLLKEKFEDVYFYNGIYVKPNVINKIKTGLTANYHAVYWFYDELARNNDYFRNQCHKQWFFSDIIIDYNRYTSYNIMNNHINYYKYSINSDDIQKYPLYKIVSVARDYKPSYLDKLIYKSSELYLSFMTNKFNK